jgi:hypothetical protein
MRPRRALCALLFASCFQAGPALSPSPSTPRSLGDKDNIPKLIWVTGQWKSDSAEVKDHMAKNIGDQPLEQRADAVRAQIQSYYAKWAPIGSFIRYLTDEDMDDSVRNISQMLAGAGIADVEKAYFNLRPGAFRADVWRLMQLWADGGVYLDANINLTHPLTDWIDFSQDELVLVTDTGVPNGIWNAMMAAEQRNQYIERAIADITGHILQHYYGTNPLAITGPIALGLSVRSRPGYPRGLRRDLEWKGGKVTNVKASDKDAAVVARKDEKLHDKNASKHYDPMWRHRQVYCDQKGPEPDNGKCPVNSWKNADGSVKYVMPLPTIPEIRRRRSMSPPRAPPSHHTAPPVSPQRRRYTRGVMPTR